MSDDLTIKDVVALAYENSKNKGWHPEGEKRNIPEMLALIHSEISEALEEYRKPEANLQEIYYEKGKPEGFGVELADTVIRIGDLCGMLGIDLEKMIDTKIEFNATRPHRHGGKVC